MGDFILSMSPEEEARIKSWVEAELQDAYCVPGDTSSPAPAVVTEAQVQAAFDLLKDTETLPRHERVSEAFARRIAEAVVRAR